jgi:tRNA-dihydrouridine synthase 3
MAISPQVMSAPKLLAKKKKKKLEDIGPECHNFTTYGHCPYGIACRWAKNHLTEDYRNIKNQELFDQVASQPSQVKNSMSKDLQHLLWKKKYDFSKSDTIVNSYYDKLREEQSDQSKKEVVSAAGDAGGSGGHKLLGCLTDEEEIKLRPQEKKLVCQVFIMMMVE